METIPLEVLQMITMTMEPGIILNLCETSKYYRDVICGDENLWRNLFLRDFPEEIEPDQEMEETWFSFYKNSYNRSKQIKLNASNVLEKLRNNEFPEKWGIGFEPKFLVWKGLLDRVPVEKIKKLFVQMLPYRRGDPNLDLAQLQIEPYNNGWFITFEIAERDIYKTIELTEDEIKQFLYYLLYHKIPLYDVFKDDIFEEDLLAKYVSDEDISFEEGNISEEENISDEES